MADEYRDDNILEDNRYIKSFSTFENGSEITYLKDKIKVIIYPKKQDKDRLNQIKLNIARTTIYSDMILQIEKLESYKLGQLYLKDNKEKPINFKKTPMDQPGPNVDEIELTEFTKIIV